MSFQVEDLLRESMVLKEALDQAVSSTVLEKLLPKRYSNTQRVFLGGLRTHASQVVSVLSF